MSIFVQCYQSQARTTDFSFQCKSATYHLNYVHNFVIYLICCCSNPTLMLDPSATYSQLTANPSAAYPSGTYKELNHQNSKSEK